MLKVRPGHASRPRVDGRRQRARLLRPLPGGRIVGRPARGVRPGAPLWRARCGARAPWRARRSRAAAASRRTRRAWPPSFVPAGPEPCRRATVTKSRHSFSGHRPATTRLGRRCSTCCTASCGSWPRRRCAGSGPTTHCSRRPWSTRPTCAWPTTAAVSRTVPTSSASRPAPCGACSWITRGPRRRRSGAAATAFVDVDDLDNLPGTPAGAVDLVALDDALSRLSSLDPGRGGLSSYASSAACRWRKRPPSSTCRPGPSSASGRWPAPG